MSERTKNGASDGRTQGSCPDSVEVDDAGTLVPVVRSRLLSPSLASVHDTLMRATLVPDPFHRPGWIYEEKVDGGWLT